MKESFYQLILKPDSNDNLIYLLIEYDDLSFSRDKITSVAISKVRSNREDVELAGQGALFKSFISSLFYGRSKEFYKILDDEIKNKKISLDLQNADFAEYFVNKTEKQ